LLGSTTCPDGQVAPTPNLILDSGLANIRYSIHGCNAQNLGTAAELSNVLTSTQTGLQGCGFLNPPEPTLEVLNAPRGGNIQVFVAANGESGALIVAGSNPELYTLEGYSQLTLAYALPGLSAHSRARLADAFAVLALGESTRQAIQSQLRDGDFTDGSEGLYDAWLEARYGISLLRSAMSNCQRSCSWPHQLNTALHARGLSADTLENEFAERAVGSSTRVQLLAALNHR